MEKENYGGNRLTQVHLNKWPLKWSVCVRMMEVVVTTGAVRRVKLQSDCHHQQTNTQLSTGWMFFLLPNQQCQSTEGKSDTYWLLCINPSLVSLQGQPKNSLWVLLGARLVLNAGCPSCHATNCDEALKNSLERCCISESFVLIRNIFRIFPFCHVQAYWNLRMVPTRIISTQSGAEMMSRNLVESWGIWQHF